MKRLLASLAIFSGLSFAAEISVVVKNDAGTIVSTTTITTTNTVLQALNQWRLAQILTPEQPGCPTCTPPVAPTPAVLRYPTAAALWRSVIREFVKPVLTEYHAAIITERAKIDAANAAIEKLKEAAVP